MDRYVVIVPMKTEEPEVFTFDDCHEADAMYSKNEGCTMLAIRYNGIMVTARLIKSKQRLA